MNVAFTTEKFVHVEDDQTFEIQLAPLLRRYGQYRRISLLSEAMQWIPDRAVRGFIIDLTLPFESEDAFAGWGEHSRDSSGLIRRIRQERPDARVVVLTNYPAQLSELLREGLVTEQDVFTKMSFDPQAVVERLRRPPEELRRPPEKLLLRPERRRPGLVPEPLPPNMDPRLHWLVAKARRGQLPAATASTREGEIAVLAQVSDIVAWRGLDEVREGLAIQRLSGKEWIVTGSLLWSAVESVYHQPFVKNLKPATPLRPALKATLHEISARQDFLPPLRAGGAGRGVVVGVVDVGCDFAHANFLNPDGTTRLLALWDQGGPTQEGKDVPFGALFEADDLNAALHRASIEKVDPYESLGYHPRAEAHGTHVLDIAAGGGRGTGVPGVAHQADLIFVALAEGPDGTLGSEEQLLYGLKFIFSRAGDQPCVINLSVGHFGGPHDGSGPLELALDDLITEDPKDPDRDSNRASRAIVIAAGNSEKGLHARGEVPPSGFTDLQCDVDPAGALSLEIWYSKQDEFAVELFDPFGRNLGGVDLGDEPGVSEDDEGSLTILLSHIRPSSSGLANSIQLFLASGAPAGRWFLRLHGRRIQDGSFHAWLVRDRSRSRLVDPDDDSCTLDSSSCSHEAIVIGAYDANHNQTPASSFSGTGPTRDGRQKPDLSAPGEKVMAARSRCSQCTVQKSGTSMAAPTVSGVVALMLAEAHAGGIRLSHAQLLDVLKAAVRKNPGDSWDSRLGWGRVDGRAAVLAVHKLLGQPDGL